MFLKNSSSMVFSIENSCVPSTHYSFKKKEVSGTSVEQISGIIMVCHDKFFTVLPLQALESAKLVIY